MDGDIGFYSIGRSERAMDSTAGAREVSFFRCYLRENSLKNTVKS